METGRIIGTKGITRFDKHLVAFRVRPSEAVRSTNEKEARTLAGERNQQPWPFFPFLSRFLFSLLIFEARGTRILTERERLVATEPNRTVPRVSIAPRIKQPVQLKHYASRRTRRLCRAQKDNETCHARGEGVDSPSEGKITEENDIRARLHGDARRRTPRISLILNNRKLQELWRIELIRY